MTSGSCTMAGLRLWEIVAPESIPELATTAEVRYLDDAFERIASPAVRSYVHREDGESDGSTRFVRDDAVTELGHLFQGTGDLRRRSPSAAAIRPPTS